VANQNSANVTVIDGATNVATTVTVGASPSAIAINPVTNKIYVANWGSNSVTVIDGANGGTATVTAGMQP
jgi:YVTN family beta-propeller protein